MSLQKQKVDLQNFAPEGHPILGPITNQLSRFIMHFFKVDPLTLSFLVGDWVLKAIPFEILRAAEKKPKLKMYGGP